MKMAIPYQAALIVNSERVYGASRERGKVHSPATGRIVGTYAMATPAEVDAAVANAHHAFVSWSGRTGYARETMIRKATAHVRTRADEIGMLMAMEQGKPFRQSRGEVIASCDLMDFYAAEAVRIEGTVNAAEQADFRSLVIHQPVGVCAAITPWNYPIALMSWKLGPALAAGCSVVVKPASVTPLSPFAFCRALQEGGLPPGVVNFVTGDSRIIGEVLLRHPLVAKLAMTGSTETGKKLVELFAPSLKKISLELGGHCPAIVCRDADLDVTAQAIAYKGFRNMGQSCSSINRIYAHEDVHDDLVARVKQRAVQLRIGDGIDPADVDLGPMTTGDGLAKVKSHVRDAIEKGARLICGGRGPEHTDGEGYYYLPTVLTRMRHDMIMMREETFGPVAPFMAFSDLDEAIRMANDTRYGLVAYLFTRDNATSFRVSERLEAGTVCVNNVSVNTGYGPYQGWKESGLGLELSRAAVHEYLNVKHIKIQLVSSHVGQSRTGTRDL